MTQSKFYTLHPRAKTQYVRKYGNIKIKTEKQYHQYTKQQQVDTIFSLLYLTQYRRKINGVFLRLIEL